MKRIVFIDHADERLLRRNLDPAWIARTLMAPEAEEPDPVHPHRIRAFGEVPERDGRVLRVIYEQDGDVLRVITAFLDRARTRRQTR